MTAGEFRGMAARLTALLDTDPAEAVRQAREIDVSGTGVARLNALSVRASILVDGGAASHQPDAVEEAVGLLREVYAAHAR